MACDTVGHGSADSFGKGEICCRVFSYQMVCNLHLCHCCPYLLSQALCPKLFLDSEFQRKMAGQCMHEAEQQQEQSGVLEKYDQLAKFQLHGKRSEH
jgi:hypothetical protein